MLAKESSKNKPTPEWKVAARALSFTAQRCSARSKATGEWKEAARALLTSAWDVFVEWHATGEHWGMSRALGESVSQVFCRGECNARVDLDATVVDSLCFGKTGHLKMQRSSVLQASAVALALFSNHSEASSASHGIFRIF